MREFNEPKLSIYLRGRFGYERIARWEYYGAFWCRKFLQILSLIACPLLAVGCIYWGHCVGSDYGRDVLLAVGVGLGVYFGTVQCSGFVRRIRIKQRLRHHYRFFKERTIETLLSAAEVKFFYHDELFQKLMQPKEFRLFFAATRDSDDKLDLAMNNLANNPAALHDLRVDIINTRYYRRIERSNVVSHDTKYLVEALYECFSDCSLISCGPCN